MRKILILLVFLLSISNLVKAGGQTPDYLTFTSNQNGSKIGFENIPSDIEIQYNIGDGWVDASTSTSITLNSGKSVQFKGDYAYASYDYEFTHFLISGNVSASGDINTLYDGVGGDINFLNYNVYKELFYNCTGLVDASGLILPSTELVPNCYECMFQGCTSLTTAPELPATTLDYMCYSGMFYDCSNLTTAPKLPATNLAEYCYSYMFYHCYSLNKISVNFTDWNSVEESTSNWVDGVAAKGTFICPDALTKDYGTSKIPNGWGAPDYLTFTSNQDGSTIGFTKIAEGAKIQYNIGDGWVDASTSTSITLNSGKSVQFKGDISGVTTENSIAIFTTNDNGNISVSGDINTLIDGNGGDINLKKYVFYKLFSNCTGLTDASELKLPTTILAISCYQSMFSGCSSLTTAPKLPATSLANSCYNSMFKGCTGLTSAPKELPATTLAESCYNSMFNGCSSLTTAPELKATTLAYGCYDEMFNGCTSLTTAPELKATTLASFCYRNMFKSCTNLTTAPELPATTLATSCYERMFYGCSSLTTAPELPATTLADYCYYYMFNGCSSLTTAPELPATTLADYCYYYMFNGCSKLNEITVNFTEWSPTSATKNWVSGVAATGTFICPSGLDETYGESNILSGWKVKHPDYLTFTAQEDDSEIGFVKIADGAKIEYNDGTGWKEASELKTTPLTLNSGQSVKFRGDYSNVTTSKTVYTQFDITGNVSASGDVNTLIDGVGGDIEELSSYNYSRMFMECAGLTDASGLKLPSTTMSESCCYQMFAACSALTKAPDLKATQMATKCYQEMFNLCTSLTEAPKLEAINLAAYCYADMFHSCSALLQGPTLLATVLSEGCYSYMFADCKSLIVAPALRATTLAKNCYKSMFKDCSSLFYVTISDCLSAFDNNYTSEWLSGVAQVGIFDCGDITQVSDIKRGANYIPEGWYVGGYYVALSEDNINEGLSLSKSKYYNKDLEGMLAKIPAYKQMPDNYIDNMYSMDDTIKVNPENYEIYDMSYQSSQTPDPISFECDKTNNTFAVSSLPNGQLVITIDGSKLYQVKYYSNDMELGTEIDQNDKTPFVFRKGAKKSDLQSSIDGCFPEIYTDAECTKQLGENELLVSYCDNGLVKLYKKPIEYTITFDANGGSDIEPTTYTIEKTIDLSTIKAEKPYYDFVKWVDKNGTEVKQISKGSFGDITLKANYTPTQYSITFDVDGGKPIDSLTYTIVSENIDLSTIKPEKEGYHFVKWLDDKDAEVTQIVNGSFGNVALTALFEAHSFSNWDTTQVATCTVAGSRTHTCACGAFETEKIDALGHTFVVDSAVSATCSATGLTAGLHCSACDSVFLVQQIVAKIAHTVVVDSAVSATCTVAGLTEGKHCSVCDSILVAQQTVPAFGHKIEIIAGVSSTCTAEGLTEGSRCSVCGEVIVAQQTIPALGHSFTNYIYNNDATYEADGTETAECDREGCNAIDVRTAEGTKLTGIAGETANAVAIYAHHNVIVVENAEADIYVYDATGRCIEMRESCPSVEIALPREGIYIVRTGDKTQRVFVK